MKNQRKTPATGEEKKAHTEPRKKPRTGGSNKKARKRKDSRKEEGPRTKTIGENRHHIIFVPSFLKKTKAERRQTTERRRSRGQESKGRRRNSSFPARSVFTNLRSKQ
jgi:hypothetical protein